MYEIIQIIIPGDETDFINITDIPDKIIQFGYCCEEDGSGEKIYINNKEIIIGNTGIFELVTNGFEKHLNIETISVPGNIKATLKYVYEQ